MLCLRTILLLVTMGLLCGIAAAAQMWQPREFLISFWCGPPPKQTDDQRYREIAEANFTCVLPPCEGPIDTKLNLKMLDLCQKHGIKAMVSDPRIGGLLNSADPVGPTLDAVVADYAKHPALEGFFITDEPNSGAFPRLAEISQGLLARDPAHLPYINLFPNYANEQQLGTKTYEEHVEKFLTAVKPPLLSYDHYALFADSERPSYFENLEIIRRQGLKHRVPYCEIILLLPHGPYRSPTMADLRWQVFTALAYGCKGILYFTYWTPPYDPTWLPHNAAVEYDGTLTQHYEMVKRLNALLKAWGPTLLKLTSRRVYHSGSVPQGCVGLPKDWLVRDAQGQEILLGELTDEDHHAYLMVVNKDLRKPQEVVLTLAMEIRGVAEISQRSGKPMRRTLEGTKGKPALRVRLTAGEGRFYRLVH